VYLASRIFGFLPEAHFVYAYSGHQTVMMEMVSRGIPENVLPVWSKELLDIRFEGHVLVMVPEQNAVGCLN
jgi:hypothetical protein